MSVSTDDPAVTRDRLIEAATGQTGLEDFGEPTWQEGLDRYLESVRDTADLNEVGVQAVEGQVVVDLSNRLLIEDWRTSHPTVAEEKIERPIVIVGQPRTGTTILFDLIAQDHTNRAPLSWEVERPVPAPRTATYRTDPRIAECQAQFDFVDSMIPGFSAFHEMGAELAQEDVRIYAADFRSMIYPIQFDIPAYNKWLLFEADMAPAYRWHRRFLQHLQSEHKAERWLLKSPAHLWSPEALMAEYPDAVVVQTHRDPLRVIASISALGANLREMTSPGFEVERLATQYGEDIVLGLDRCLEARRNGVFPADQVVDVRFQDFTADPIATVGAIYDQIGLELTAEAETRMRDFLVAHPGDQSGGLKRYSFADTGLDENAYRERAQAYQDHFDVISEPLG